MKIVPLSEFNRRVRCHTSPRRWLKRLHSPATAYLTDMLFMGWRECVRELGPGEWVEETPIKYAEGETLEDLLERLERDQVDILWNQTQNGIHIYTRRKARYETAADYDQRARAERQASARR